MNAVTGIRSAAATPVPHAPALRVVSGTANPPANHPTAARPPLRVVDEARDICAISRSTVQAAIEVLAGTRPAQQLSRRLHGAPGNRGFARSR